MHRQRVFSALLLALPFLALVQFGSSLHFSLLVSVVIALLAWEFARLCPSGADPALSVLTVVGALAWHGALLVGGGAPALAAGLVGVALARALGGGQDFRRASLQAAWAVLGALYAGGLLGTASLVRALPDGRALIYYAVTTTWAADVGAFYVGRRWGRRALAPRVSPKKTIEGVAGGLIAAAAAAALGSGSLWPMAPLPAVLAALFLGGVGIVGDLAESAVKRAAGVKDSSGLIPGHGGVLDRLDSLIFVTPALYALAWLGWL